MGKFLVLLTLFTSLTAFASGVKLIDYMVSSSGVSEMLSKFSIKGSDAQQVKSYVSASLNALNIQSATPTKKDILDSLAKIPMTGEDASTRAKLQVLLDKPDAQLTKDDFVTAVNHLIYLANRHGKNGSVIISCADCVNENLAKAGFKFTVEEIKNTNIKTAIASLPNDPKKLNDRISSNVRKLGFGNYSRVTPDQVAPEEEKSFATFLELATVGTKDQKELIKAIADVSRNEKGSVDMFNANNSHKLWKLLTTEMSPEDMGDWTNLLKNVAEAGKGKSSKKEAFYSELERIAGDNPSKKQMIDELKKKGCFFK